VEIRYQILAYCAGAANHVLRHHFSHGGITTLAMPFHSLLLLDFYFLSDFDILRIFFPEMLDLPERIILKMLQFKSSKQPRFVIMFRNSGINHLHIHACHYIVQVTWEVERITAKSIY